jgi:hypothetical protein
VIVSAQNKIRAPTEGDGAKRSLEPTQGGLPSHASCVPSLSGELWQSLPGRSQGLHRTYKDSTSDTDFEHQGVAGAPVMTGVNRIVGLIRVMTRYTMSEVRRRASSTVTDWRTGNCKTVAC